MVNMKKENSLVKKIVLRVVTIATIAVFVLIIGYCAIQKFSTPKQEKRHAMVDKQLSYCQELVTMKYRYSDIVSIKKSSGFSKSYTLIKYSGIIRAGIADFSDITYNISYDGKKVFMKMPKAEILGNEIVKQEVFDESNSIFVPISTKEVFQELKKSQDETCADLIAEGLLEDARTYAINIVKQFLYNCGFEEVIIQ